MNDKLKPYLVDVYRVRTVIMYATSKSAAIKEAKSRLSAKTSCDEWICEKSVKLHKEDDE